MTFSRSVKIALMSVSFVGISVLPVLAQTHSADLPILSETSTYNVLEEKSDSKLQARLETEINQRPKWKQLVEEKKMSVSLVDISNITNPSYAALNGEHTLYAASLPKIGILLAAFQKIHDGDIVDTPRLRDDLTQMIRVSSNVSATKVIDELGGLDAVNTVLKDPRYQLYDEENGGGLWVGKRFAKTGARIGDPMKDISHAASSYQVSRFYYLLATGRLVSPEASKDMLDILCQPGIDHKFVASLSRLVNPSQIFRKSGSWRNYHSDSVLVLSLIHI